MDGIQADELELAVVQGPNEVHARPDVKADGGRVVAGAEQVVPALRASDRVRSSRILKRP